jgi:transposase InsO family protein
MAELCRVHGISRQTGYLWLRRFVDAGHDVAALEDRSRRPHHSPTAVPHEMEDIVVAARKQHPRWGPRTLHSWLAGLHPGREFPCASTVALILKRNGLSEIRRRRRRRRRVPVLAEPLGEANAPNQIWCIDYKGQFRTGDGEMCYPFTVLDAFSRFCIRCEATTEPGFAWSQHVLDSAFREFGLPAAIRSDNGPPFAANGPAGLSALAVWLLRLGLRLERIAPGNPQQNGRLERFHRTLKGDTATPPKRSMRVQQRVFNFFRREYNEERPHQAISMKPPAALYVPSSRRYPCALVSIPEAGWMQRLRVDPSGHIRWGRTRVFISAALCHEYVDVTADGDTRWAVRFGAIELGHFDDRKPDVGLISVKRPRKPHHLQLSEKTT